MRISRQCGMSPMLSWWDAASAWRLSIGIEENKMKIDQRLLILGLALLALSGVASIPSGVMPATAQTAPARPKGPCDIYAAAGDPCVAAHSTTRALYAAYNGPLYQVMRQSDGRKIDIGVVRPSGADGGGYANAAAQDAFCANTYCWISIVY